MGSTAVSGVSWPIALRLGRVSNLPTVWTNVLAGAVLSGGLHPFARALPLMGALSLFYVAGMYLNDAFDAAYDREHRPGRPIPSGAVTASTVLAIGAALIGCGLLSLLAFGLLSNGTGLRGFAGGLALAVAILVYDLWHKRNPIGPLLMGLCRALVYVTTAAAIAGALPHDLLWAAAIALCYLIGLTSAAKQEDLKQPGRPPFWRRLLSTVFQSPQALSWASWFIQRSWPLWSTPSPSWCAPDARTSRAWSWC